jgi:hypothetical protein
LSLPFKIFKQFFSLITINNFEYHDKNFSETLLFASVAINAALLLFIAGVLRKTMNAMDAAAFKNLTELLVRYSSKSPFMIIVLNIPLLGAIPYCYFFGF